MKFDSLWWGVLVFKGFFFFYIGVLVWGDFIISWVGEGRLVGYFEFFVGGFEIGLFF